MTSSAIVFATFQCVIPHQSAVVSSLTGQRTVAEGVVEITGDTRMKERTPLASLVVAVGPIIARTRRRCNAVRTGPLAFNVWSCRRSESCRRCNGWYWSSFLRIISQNMSSKTNGFSFMHWLSLSFRSCFHEETLNLHIVNYIVDSTSGQDVRFPRENHQTHKPNMQCYIELESTGAGVLKANSSIPQVRNIDWFLKGETQSVAFWRHAIVGVRDDDVASSLWNGDGDRRIGYCCSYWNWG